MPSTNETAQPVNPAITEADVFAFIARSKERVNAATAGLAEFGAKPDIFVFGGHLRISAFINPGFESVGGDGHTIEEALTAFCAALIAKRITPQSLRDKAAELLSQAEVLEHGGAK